MLMEAFKVRTGIPALMRSRAMWTCAFFVLFCVPFLAFFLVEWNQADGTLKNLYGLAASLPACGLVVAVASMCVVWGRRRKAVLVVDQQINIPKSGVSFALQELETVQIWSDQHAHSHVALLPGHIEERITTADVAALAPYIVTFPPGSDPQPYELAEILLSRKPDIKLDRLGRI